MQQRSSVPSNPVSRTRRDALRRLGAGAALLAGVRAAPAWSATDAPAGRASPGAAALRTIPSSGVRVPCIGMGTWLTFDLAPGRPGTDTRVDVLQAFLDAGGGMIDSSPMYGEAEAMIGHALERTTHADDAPFAASKIWTPFGAMAEGQMRNTESLWGVRPMRVRATRTARGAA